MTYDCSPQAASTKHSTYKTLLYIFIAVTLSGVLATLMLSNLLKKQAVEELATAQAEQQAEIIFKALWQGMMQGWTKKDMDHFIHSIELNQQERQVQIIRSQIIDDQFGSTGPSQQALQADPILGEVMSTGQISIIQSDSQIRYLYPIKANQGCLGCHTNSHPGAIHGVIDLRFSDQPLQKPLTAAFNLYITISLMVVILLCALLFLILRTRIVRPMRALSRQIKDAIKDDLSVNRIDAAQFHLKEPFQLAQSFNQLAQELEDYHQQLKAHSCTDALTGLYNRRYFDEQMPNLLKQSHSTEQPLTLMLIDLDRFKDINDTYGHEAGDLALIFFATILKQQVKPDDLVIRLGGDEFVIVLTQTDIRGALAVKRRLTEALFTKRANLGVVSLHLEASVGSATYPTGAEDTDELLTTADKAMYQDKEARRALRK